MGLEYFKRPLFTKGGLQIEAPSTFTKSVVFNGTTAGLQENVQTLNTTATLITGFGVTLLGAGGSTTDKVYKLANPSAAGVHKYIISNATGAQKVSVVMNTTANTFMNTTSGTIVFSTNSTKQRSAHLIAVSTAKWWIVARSTGTTLAG